MQLYFSKFKLARQLRLWGLAWTALASLLKPKPKLQIVEAEAGAGGEAEVYESWSWKGRLWNSLWPAVRKHLRRDVLDKDLVLLWKRLRWRRKFLRVVGSLFFCDFWPCRIFVKFHKAPKMMEHQAEARGCVPLRFLDWIRARLVLGTRHSPQQVPENHKKASQLCSFDALQLCSFCWGRWRAFCSSKLATVQEIVDGDVLKLLCEANWKLCKLCKLWV